MANKKNEIRKRIKHLYCGNQRTCPSSFSEDHILDNFNTITTSTSAKKLKLSQIKTLENDNCYIFMNLSVIRNIINIFAICPI